ncbi:MULTISPECIES: hypothetical protein [Bradyrhizobium]|uniref:hypothetical protein n=1 Tax=Bradyrhizobium TaxID=374 RepID=UPI001CD1E1DD|nr:MULTISPECIES: hypothetical protein [Bradyrhizobium]MCA1414360.1 hypothetical protein [Bradyrhizobium sp. NBAIM20]MCA1465616.1 hypothetical protein [Bradyrhizobium sp. NBAIM18]MCA1530077.1 hypothetical protein [Bradyrhizobium yuanmingense]
MKRFAASCMIASLFLTSAHAENGNAPAFFVLDERSGHQFDMQAWQQAAKASKGGQFVRTYRLLGDDSVLRKARDDAAKAKASDNVVHLMTTTTPDKNSREFRESLAQLKQQFQTDPKFKGVSALAEWPMCALVQLGPGNDGSSLRGTMLFVLNHPQASAACYPLVQIYFTTPPGPDGKRIAPVRVDSTSVALQAALPPMKLARKMLADKAAFQQGKLIERPTNVFAPAEEIFLHAYFENVGRKDVGTPMASYEIGLDIEVRDETGKVVKAFPDEHTYKGASPPPFPESLDYFTNFVTAGITIGEPGEYTIAYIFHDRSRQETPPVAAEFAVTVK